MLQDAIKKLLSVVLLVLLARYFSAEDFGNYQQLVMIASLITVIANAGVPVSVSFFGSQKETHDKKIAVFSKLFSLQCILLLIGATLYYLTSEGLAELLNNSDLVNFYWLIVLLFISLALQEYFKNLCTVNSSLKLYLLIISFVQIISTLIAILILFIHPTVFNLLLVLVIGNCISSIALVFFNRKLVFKLFYLKLLSKEEIKYIISMASVSLIGVLNAHVDQVMVSALMSPADYAMLRVGAFQIPIIGIVTGSLLTAMIPVISKLYKEENNQEIIKVWSTSIEKATFLIVPVVIFCLVFGEEIIISFFGQKYQEAVIVFQVYMFQWLRAVVIFGGVMGAIGLEKKLFKNTVFIALANAVCNYFMIHRFGVIGAAITTTALNYLGALVLINSVDKKLKQTFFSYFPTSKYLFSLIASLIICLFLKFLLNDLWFNLVFLLFGAAFYYVTLIACQMKFYYGTISLKKFKEIF